MVYPDVVSGCTFLIDLNGEAFLVSIFFKLNLKFFENQNFKLRPLLYLMDLSGIMTC